MSSQNTNHPPISFSISHPFQSVRLVEVPDDLLKYLTSTTSSTPRLKFKSAGSTPPSHFSTSTTTTAQSQKDEILHLCTNEKAWAVKQVSTSNSVYLIQPSIPPALPAISTTETGIGDDDDDAEMLDEQDSDDASNTLQAALPAIRGAVTASSRIHNFLELHPVPIDLATVTRSIIDLLPIHHPPLSDTRGAEEEVDLDLQSYNNSKMSLSLSELVDNIPFPDEIVYKQCHALGTVELHYETRNVDNMTICTIPSTRAMLRAWTALIQACTIANIKLDSNTPLNTTQILNALSSDTDNDVNDQIILHAILRQQGVFDQAGLFAPSASINGQEGERTLKPMQTCHFIAGLLVTAVPNLSMPKDEFLEKWTDLVPSGFVRHCTLNGLAEISTMFEVSAEDDKREVVRWKGAVEKVGKGFVLATSVLDAMGATSSDARAGKGGGGGGSAAVSTQETTKPVIVDKKRKWHEKFGAQRNLKR